jgi:hypothetical protein
LAAAVARPKKANFTINVRDNGVHSFQRGIDSYKRYAIEKDPMLLKDSIMFLHHGIELLMKAILITQSDYLIFESLKDIAERKRQADRLGVGIFFLDNSPKAVGFEEAINRVDAFFKPPELTKKLRDGLTNLNGLRNQIEHYAIEADESDVERLLGDLHLPLTKLFEARLGKISESLTLPERETLTTIGELREVAHRAEIEVIDLMNHFNAQFAPGTLFSSSGDVLLPAFVRIIEQGRVPNTSFMVDIIGESPAVKWLVLVKVIRGRTQQVILNFAEVALFESKPTKDVRWLVIFGKASAGIKSWAQKYGIYVSGEEEMKELSRIVGKRKS